MNYLDTLTVTEEMVQDPDNFFKVMAEVTENKAFSHACQFRAANQNQSSDQEDVIEKPNWFSPKSFNSLAFWLVVTLEENLWAQ